MNTMADDERNLLKRFGPRPNLPPEMQKRREETYKRWQEDLDAGPGKIVQLYPPELEALYAASHSEAVALKRQFAEERGLLYLPLTNTGDEEWPEEQRAEFEVLNRAHYDKWQVKIEACRKKLEEQSGGV